MENSKEHLRTILDEAIPKPHFNVINFRALRELLENTIELQTSSNITDCNCVDVTNSLNNEAQESNTQSRINDLRAGRNITDEMSSTNNSENQLPLAIPLSEGNVIPKTESFEMHMSQNKTGEMSIFSKDQHYKQLGEHINKSTKN